MNRKHYQKRMEFLKEQRALVRDDIDALKSNYYEEQLSCEHTKLRKTGLVTYKNKFEEHECERCGWTTFLPCQ